MAAKPEEVQKTLIFSQNEDAKVKCEVFQLSAEELKKLAESGHPDGQNMLGISLRRGLLGLKMNQEEGAKWIVLAAKSQSPAGVHAQGLCYELGIGDQIVKNLEMAKDCYKKAAEQFYTPALYEWAEALYGEEEAAEKTAGYAAAGAFRASHREIHQKIVSMVATCAQRGYAPAQNRLGYSYYKGWGCQKDLAEAKKLWLLAADQGHVKARYNLGTLYRDGAGVPKDKEEARRWFTLAAEQGHQEALNGLKSSCTLM